MHLENPIHVYTFFLAKAIPSWPKPDLDYEAEVRRLMDELQDVAAEITRARDIAVTFHEGPIVLHPGDVALPADLEEPVDLILFFNITSGVGQLIDPVIDLADEREIPAVMFAQPYSGHDWSIYARLRQFGLKFDIVASSDFSELIPRLAVVAALKRLEQTRVLVVTFNSAGNALGQQLQARYGTEFTYVPYEEVQAKYEQVADAPATELADRWIAHAERVVEPTREDVIESARLYLAIAALLADHDADGITINCLGGFAKGVLPAYPCLAFTKLNDAGQFGVCEADVASTFTQIVGTYLCGRPGFVSDPVFDTGKAQLIHAHCVSATRLDGCLREDGSAPEGTTPAPYRIRTHMEDNKGVSLQVLFREGEAVTCMKFVSPDKVLASTGTITEAVDGDRGCRTKFATRVSHLRYMLEHWTGGLHRVVFYGDLTPELAVLERFTPARVVREDIPQ